MKFLRFLLEIGIINTFVFNIKYFGFISIFKPKILIARNVKLMKLKGKILLSGNNKISHIGFSENLVCCGRKNRTVFFNEGDLIINGHFSVFKGCSIIIRQNASLIIGKDFSMSQCSTIQAYKSISIGSNCTISWDCLIMDSDTHPIIDQNSGQIINNNDSIIISDHVWICSDVKILKGAVVPRNCILGTGSIVTKKLSSENSIYVNNAIVKEKITFDTKKNM